MGCKCKTCGEMFPSAKQRDAHVAKTHTKK
jgi:uncharacterized C2H2 Zn-finger protein